MTTEFWNEDDLITKFLDELMNVISHLPYPAGIRSALKYNVATDFFESWQFDDAANKFSITTYNSRTQKSDFPDAKFTEGIINFEQANRYVYEFIKLLKHTRVEVLEELFFPHNLFGIDQTKKKKGLNYKDIVKQTYVRSVKSNILSDQEFVEQFMKICGDNLMDIPLENFQAINAQLPSPHDINKIILEQVSLKIYAVEELEFMLCHEAVNKFMYNIHHLLRFDYDSGYFSRYINGPLKIKFTERLREKLAPLNDFDALFHLHNSDNQFVSHAPDLRYHDLYDKFWKMFIFPKQNHDEVSEPFIKYMDDVIRPYEVYFFDYGIIVADILKEYKTKSPELARGFEILTDSATTQEDSNHQDSPIKLKKDPSNIVNKSKLAFQPSSFTYKNNDKNYNAIADLLDCLQKNNFIALDTDKKDFRKIFENKKPNKPITWTGRISYLFLFVKLIHSKYKLIDKLGKKVWVISDQLFVDKNGEAFGSKRLKGQKVPNDATAIENAVALLK